MINVLYLDDEERNLQSFKASFRREYNIHITTSIDEANRIIDNSKVHIVLADQRMPGMTGAQFFEQLRQRNPDPIRILITGHTDTSAAIDAINKGEVLRFIDKPWDYSNVQTAINHGYEIYRNKEELALRNADLKKAYEELDRFVYSASHDLRAPLMSVLGLVNIAVVEDESKHREYLHLIKQSVLKLDAFVLSVIDYYKNARGVPVVDAVDFKELAEGVRDAIKYMPGFDQVKHTLTINQTGEFRSDIVKLRIILNNLLTNAVKFVDPNKQGHIFDLTVNADSNACSIVISDNGIGIKEKDIDNIFNMFYRASAKVTGSGIGLYILSEAVNKLGGTINVYSVYGEGARFEITLPSIKE
jgi:signal transduction histidine kinase